ncbi:MAG: tetratricopeptide repeat protein [Gammaproteobacteria bacterium]|nr:tetratricopeptide repeat protein [Gammaproteobacteria bacterium]
MAWQKLNLIGIAVLLSACEAEQPPQLIEALDDREYRIEKRKSPDITREQVVNKYREFIDYASGEPMYGNAIRRLADIELESAETENLTANNDKQLETTRRKMEAAIRMYETYLDTYPHRENVDLILYQLAKAYDLTGDYLGTLNTLTRLVDNYPDSRHYIESQFRRGEMLFSLGRYKTSEQAYEKIVKQTESSIFREKAMFKYGWAMFKQSKFTPALHAFFDIIDKKHQAGLIQEAKLSPELPRTEQELLDDLFRVVSLSFTYQNGASGIKRYFTAFGSRSYEPLVYSRLATTYLTKDRYTDAADTYLTFGNHYPNSLLAPDMHQEAINIYKNGKFPSLQLAAKASFIKRYNVNGKYWDAHDISVRQKLSPLLQTHIRELANHHHSLARKSKGKNSKSKNYTKAVAWYRTYIKSFPDDTSTPAIHFLLAEAYDDSGNYDRSIIEFEKVAYSYPLHKKNAEAGYAALVAYSKLIKQNEKRKLHQPELISKNIESALKFSSNFPEHKQKPTVLTHTSEQLFKAKDYPRAVEAAQIVIDSPRSTKRQSLTAYTVIAHSQFALQDYAVAELAYQEALSRLSKKSTSYKELQNKLAASIYKQGEKSKQEGKLALAAEHFMRLGVLVPTSKFRATAEYDAAAIYIQQQNWKQAEKILIGFRKKYPRNKKYRLGITEKLATVYSKTGKPLKAAREMEELASLSGKSSAYKQDMLWQAATLYQDGKKNKDATRLYRKFVKSYPGQYPESIEARYQIAMHHKDLKQPRKQVYWLKETVKAERRAGKKSNERTKFLAAQSSLTLAYPLMTNYRKTALVIPLKKSLKRKKSLMEKTIKAYQHAMNYRVADITTSATYHIAEIYHDFSRSLLKSQRPKGLSNEELEQYDILLEEQAFPFEEKAIKIHSSNIKHTKDGIYDKWIKRSLKQLSQLQPIRYAKFEKGANYAEDLH